MNSTEPLVFVCGLFDRDGQQVHGAEAYLSDASIAYINGITHLRRLGWRWCKLSTALAYGNEFMDPNIVFPIDAYACLPPRDRPDAPDYDPYSPLGPKDASQPTIDDL